MGYLLPGYSENPFVVRCVDWMGNSAMSQSIWAVRCGGPGHFQLGGHIQNTNIIHLTVGMHPPSEVSQILILGGIFRNLKTCLCTESITCRSLLFWPAADLHVLGGHIKNMNIIHLSVCLASHPQTHHPPDCWSFLKPPDCLYFLKPIHLTVGLSSNPQPFPHILNPSPTPLSLNPQN